MNAPSSYPNPLLRGFWLSGVERPTMWYRFGRRCVQMTLCMFWKLRVFNKHLEPPSGGVVYISNHQSYFDPIIASVALRRPMSFMARDTLFKNPLFGRLISSFNAFPLKRDKADISAMKEAMRRLKKGGQITIFAEGERTLDGRINPFLPGVYLLAKRAAEWVVPVVLDGGFEAWPKGTSLPSIGNIVVQYAKPIHQTEVRKTPPKEFLKNVRQTLIDMQKEVRERAGKPQFSYDDID